MSVAAEASSRRNRRNSRVRRRCWRPRNVACSREAAAYTLASAASASKARLSSSSHSGGTGTSCSIMAITLVRSSAVVRNGLGGCGGVARGFGGDSSCTVPVVNMAFIAHIEPVGGAAVCCCAACRLICSLSDRRADWRRACCLSSRSKELAGDIGCAPRVERPHVDREGYPWLLTMATASD